MIITVVLEALTGTFNTDIDRSAKQAERAMKRLEKESLGALDKVSKALLATATAAATAFALMGKRAIDNADRLGELAQKAAVSAQALQAIGYVAKQSGSDIESVTTALQALNRATISAQDGTGAQAEAFRALRIELEDANGNIKTTEQLFNEIADAFASAEDNASKTAIAMTLLGKAGAELIPTLNQGSKGFRAASDELQRFGGLLSDETIKAADQFNDNVERLKTAVQAFAAQAAAQLLPRLIEITEQFLALASDGPRVKQAIDNITESLKGLAVVLGAIAGARIGAAVGGIPGALVGAGVGGVATASAINRITATTEEKLAALQEQLTRLESQRDTIQRFGGHVSEVQLNEIKRLQGEIENLTKTAEAIQGGDRFGQFLDDAGFTRTKSVLDFDPEAAQRAAAAAKKAAAEARRLQEALAQGAAEIFQAQQERERAILEASLDARQISYKDYLSERLRLTEAAIDQEIAASQSLLQNAEADEAVLLQARIESLEIRRQIAQDEAAQDEAKHVREISAAYDDATASARSYLNAITREGERTLALLSATPAQRRFAQGQFQIEDQFTSAKEQLDRQLAAGLEKEVYDQQLQVLQDSLANQSAEWQKYFDAIEAKQNDFTTSFNNAIQEYVDATSNVGQALGDTLVSAFDRAADGISHAAAELILFGEDGRAAIAALARSIATELLSALIRVGIQALINKTLISSTTAGAGGGGFASLFGFASGGYVGDDPRNKVAGVVHGQEFVVNADATRENRALLEQINNGTLSDGVSVPRASTQSSKTGMTQRIINVWDKSDIKDYLMGSDGDDVFINWAGRNGSRLRSIIQSA